MIDIINNWLEDTKLELIANYVRTGIIASGKYGEELESKIQQTGTGYKATILGAYHSKFMENGRVPNKDQNEDSIRRFVGWAGSTFLKQWVIDKEINISPFAVAYKIAREGYKPQSDNVIGDVINDKRIEQLLNVIKDATISNIKSDVIKNLS